MVLFVSQQRSEVPLLFLLQRFKSEAKLSTKVKEAGHKGSNDEKVHRKSANRMKKGLMPKNRWWQSQQPPHHLHILLH